MIKTKEFDIAEYLDTEELRKSYIDFVSKENNPKELEKALIDVERSRYIERE